MEWVESALRLSTQAGWNQSREDWVRLLKLPQGFVKVLIEGAEVRASYSIVSLGSDLCWIGMLLVDESLRGRGLGKAAFASALQDAMHWRNVGLDATTLGEPIYVKHGFQPVRTISRWSGMALAPRRAVPHHRIGLHEGILAFDAAELGVDRSNLLRAMAATDTTFFSFENEGKTTAYGAIRPGRTAWQLGPVLATSVEGFDCVLELAMATCAGEEIFCDVLRSDAAGSLTAKGMTPRRHLQRMALPYSPDCLCAETVWCAAGFELG
jgi:GNAT superfamily N-acetyltransferase